MNKVFGMNETKVVYCCKKCNSFKLYTRRVGNEDMPKIRRQYCYTCGEYTKFQMLEEEENTDA